MSTDIPVYVICSTKEIRTGQAKAFSLSRLDENGEARPFSIFVVRTTAGRLFGYRNQCPHQGVWLNIGAGEFFNEDHSKLRCGRHGAEFEIETGACAAGDCEGKALEPVAVVDMDGDVCILGVELAEDDGAPDPFEDFDDTMEVMIHPD